MAFYRYIKLLYECTTLYRVIFMLWIIYGPKIYNLNEFKSLLINIIRNSLLGYFDDYSKTSLNHKAQLHYKFIARLL